MADIKVDPAILQALAEGFGMSANHVRAMLGTFQAAANLSEDDAGGGQLGQSYVQAYQGAGDSLLQLIQLLETLGRALTDSRNVFTADEGALRKAWTFP